MKSRSAGFGSASRGLRFREREADGAGSLKLGPELGLGFGIRARL